MHRTFWIALVLLPFLACTKSSNPNEQRLIEVSLYTGIPGIAKIGDSYNSVINRAQFAYTVLNGQEDARMKALNFTDGLLFKEIGTRVYFRRNGVALISMQEPFKGLIKGKNIRLFAFAVPPVKDWDELIEKELGNPESRASGGRFGSESLFYNWGDISYNKMGPNEMALYRDSEISKYRQSNFGREITFFPDRR